MCVCIHTHTHAHTQSERERGNERERKRGMGQGEDTAILLNFHGTSFTTLKHFKVQEERFENEVS